MDIALKMRMRRNRRSEIIRNGLAETQLGTEHLVYPLFLCPGKNKNEPIKSMPEISRLSVDLAIREIASCVKMGVSSFAIFPVIPEHKKNSKASESTNPKGFAIQSLKEIRRQFKEIILYTDVALDPFSSDGHDGLVVRGKVVNDASVDLLTEMALLQSAAGADYVCPSDMMDGRVQAIRKAMDQNGFTETGILAYSAKYASSFYGPFREALDSAPKFGDKKTYQMDYRNSREALREVELDIQEGADIVMVKPALSYLDIIKSIKDNFAIPVAAYNVSGEYAMVKFAAKAGALNEDLAVKELLHSFRRAGADLIFTYFAKQYAMNLKKKSFGP